MHEDFKTFSQKSTQKFHNNFINFEKPQIFFFKRTKNLGLMHEMHEEWRI